MTNYVLAREYLPKSTLSIDLNEKRFIYEISVPTCSYRMGVNRIGYGVLLLDSGKNLIKQISLKNLSIYLFRNKNCTFIYSFNTTKIYLIISLCSLWHFFSN